MLRIVSLAALATVLAVPAFAADNAPAADAHATQSFTAQLTALANEKQVRQVLASQGYIVSSDLNRDDAGRWVGTALKDGKTVRVALKMPPRAVQAPLTN